MNKALLKWVAGLVSVRGVMCVLFLSGVSLAGCGPFDDDLVDGEEVEQVDPVLEEEDELEEDLDEEEDGDLEDDAEEVEEDLNQDPIADAGDDQDVAGRTIVQLDCTASSDPDGDDLSHSWTQLSGPSVALTGASTPTPTFEAPNEDVELEFEVTVDDGKGGSDSDSMSVLVTAKRARLYIANIGGFSVTSYEDPALVNGNLPPDTNLQGAQTLLLSPSDIIVTAEGTLIASNFGSSALTSYEDAPTTNGNFAPDGNVAGAATDLVGPASLAVNKGQDLAFVANLTSDEITVYAGVSASSFNGNLAPVRTIATTTTGDLATPIGINFGAGDELYVANAGPDNVLVFANASNLNGDVSPSRIITCTDFDAIFDVFIDSQDKMYVVDSFDGEVYIFDDASSLNGAQIPDFTLTIPGAVFLTAIAVDSEGTGYVVDLTAEAIYSYDDIGNINGAFTPDRTIAGAQTLMDSPIRVFLEE
ncbi:MAG: hypothetical protein O7D91_09105 [Planctomycetota bacterium]|nr:hypothetical protein [Planctomycetota bacterium]